MKKLVVIGGGISGLLCAHALVPRFAEIEILDRDYMDQLGPRRGVSQAQHLHVLLKRGRLALEALLPGIDAQLAERECPEIDWAQDTLWIGRFGEFPRYPSGIRTRSCSRELLERVIRERVARDPKIKLTERFEASSFDGKSVRDASGRTIPGDFFIDATGRTGPFRASARSQKIDASISYASCFIRLHPSYRPGFRQAYVQLQAPLHARGGVMIPVEGGLHLLTLLGAGGEHPPTTTAEFEAFAASLRHPVIHELLQNAEFVSPIRAYRRTAGIRASQSAIRAPNFLAVGDALCAFNPVYGQGMTVAALTALLLQRRFGQDHPRRLQRRIFKHGSLPWILGASEDLRVTGRRTQRISPLERLSLRALGLAADLLLKRAVRSKRAHECFLNLLHLMEAS